MTTIASRRSSPDAEQRLIRSGVHPVLARLYAARGVQEASELDEAFSALLPPSSLLHAERAAALLADAIETGASILVVADYDCDGATACAVALRALKAFGASADYFVPDRFVHGYGLTPRIVNIAAERGARVIVTVDNGIASNEGVDAANALGMQVIVTDHHLPGPSLPRAAAIVNPHQPGCGFTSKCIAGVGVIFYVMLALRAEFRRRGAFAGNPEPRLDGLLDLVALGTVADVVRLDRNNRVLVSQGLKRIRSGRMQPGVKALFAASGRDPARAGTFDLAFMLGPRLNAAGRLEDMSLGIECLVTEDAGQALNMARRLDELNRERRALEAGMQAQADELLGGVDVGGQFAICLFDPAWHPGVVGLLASRLKDRHHRPVMAFAPASPDNREELRGSGRSIPGLHLRDALDLVDRHAPGLMLRFGGHAAAAGITLRAQDFARFAELFEQAVRAMLPAADLALVLETDGELASAYLSLETARLLESRVWGQGFPAPLFCDRLEVRSQRLLADKHLKARVECQGRVLEGLRFNSSEPMPGAIRAAYRLSVNEFNGIQGLQLVIEHWEPAA